MWKRMRISCKTTLSYLLGTLNECVEWRVVPPTTAPLPSGCTTIPDMQHIATLGLRAQRTGPLYHFSSFKLLRKTQIKCFARCNFPKATYSSRPARIAFRADEARNHSTTFGFTGIRAVGIIVAALGFQLSFGSPLNCERAYSEEHSSLYSCLPSLTSR